MSIALTALVITFAVLLFLGAPVFVVLALPSALYLIIEGLPLELIPQRIFTGIDIFLLLAIPLFMLAGEVMNAGRLTDKLVEFSAALVGKVRGGLAMVNVLTSMLFAGITGSAAADASAIGSMMIPMMSKQGYPKAFSVAVTAASSIVGPIIPPSIVFIMFGVLASTSIIDLFLAGIVPGILLGLSQMIVIQLMAKKRGFASGQPTSVKRIVSTGSMAIPAMVLPFIILGGILGGIFTPTEAGAVAVLYGLIVAGLIYRRLNAPTVVRMGLSVGRSLGELLLIIGASNLLAWILVSEQVPARIAEGMLLISSDPIILLLMINILLFFVGMFLDTFPALIILTPILLPIAATIGVEPLHLGVIMVLNLMIGTVTPPVGVCLFIACNIGNVEVEAAIKEIVPFILASMAVVLLITFVPELSTTVPSLFREWTAP
jgi:tripartite ATP-independent transporter DctM subunit